MRALCWRLVEVMERQKRRNRMLKVLHIGKYYPPFHGGIENFLCDLAECQLEQGDVEPSVLVHQHEVGCAEETETTNGVFVRRVQIVGRAVFTPLAPLFLRSLNRTIEERNPDILHLHLPNPSTFWCLFSKSARKRSWVIHWHSDVLADKRGRSELVPPLPNF